MNIISSVSIAGVAVATMAIVVVLSVFNGFTKLSQRQLSKIDPDLKITLADNRMIANADSLAELVAALQGVAEATPTIEERAMLISSDGQTPVVFKAVADDYTGVINLDDIVIDGAYLSAVDTCDAMQISVGVANRTGLRPSLTSFADIYVPRRKGRINVSNPAASFRSASMMVTAVTQADQAEIDNDRIIIPLTVARHLLDYTTEATAIELSVDRGADVGSVAREIKALLGEGYSVQDRYMQQEEAFRMIEIEKWVTFMMLVFILVIASFNIISTLSLLVAEKRGNMSTLRALGASKRFVRQIFIWQGFLITVFGGMIGIVLGIVLSLAQEYLGLIKLSGDPATLTIDVYPVSVEAIDIVAVIGAIVVIAAITSQITRIFTKNIR